MFGMTRSTPSISSSGNMSPASTAMIASPYSRSIMFLPISPRPPRGITRSFLRAMSSLEQLHLYRLRVLGVRFKLKRPLGDGGELLEAGLDRAGPGGRGG